MKLALTINNLEKPAEKQTINLLLPITIARKEPTPEGATELAGYLWLDSSKVSSVAKGHARIEKEGEQVFITDLKSTNGTKVNGADLTAEEKTLLKDGDVVNIYPYELTLEVLADKPVMSEPTVHVPSVETTPLPEEFPVPPAPPEGMKHESMEHDMKHEESMKDEESMSMKHDSPSPLPEELSAEPESIKHPPPISKTPTPSRNIDQGNVLQEFAPKPEDEDDNAPITIDFSLQTGLVTRDVGTYVPRQEFNQKGFTDERLVSVKDLHKQGLVKEMRYLSVGGGVGSFIWIDHLLIYGASPEDVWSIGNNPVPYGRYKELCGNSQIPDHERLRSNSDSCPDNIWGWPGYAGREIARFLSRGRIDKALKMFWQIFNEPVTQTYTPKAGNVFKSIDREAERIGWDNIWHYGRVYCIRKTDDGRYAVAYSPVKDDTIRVHYAVTKYLHLSTGYPATQFLPDLQAYRVNTGDAKHVVNAYEPHDHVYKQLSEQGGTVLIRGRGIVASRVIQRIYEARKSNPNVNIRILHLLRSRVSKKKGRQKGYVEGVYGKSKRPVEDSISYQPFNWPKAAWSGGLLKVLEKSNDDRRTQLLKAWGGTTTADRKDWKRILKEGQQEGWYLKYYGNVKQVEPNDSGQVVTVISGRAFDEETSLVADFIVDATGLAADPKTSPLLKDLIDTYELELNGLGRLKVANNFEIVGMRNDRGQVHASGAITLGGPYAAVDSFLGLQYSAQRSVDTLARIPSTSLHNLNGFSSLNQWLRWVRGVQP